MCAVAAVAVRKTAGLVAGQVCAAEDIAAAEAWQSCVVAGEGG